MIIAFLTLLAWVLFAWIGLSFVTPGRTKGEAILLWCVAVCWLITRYFLI